VTAAVAEQQLPPASRNPAVHEAALTGRTSGHTCAYEGVVVHRRRTPTEHSFRYRVFMMYLDLDDVDRALSHHLLWSARRPAPARWRRRDHPGDPAQPLDDWVRALVAERTGVHPTGPVRLLTHLRYVGRWFNPISLYYCFDDNGETLQWVVTEVTSTPWRERSHHVLDVRGGARVASGTMAKDLHVSPFLPMALDYRWRLTRPNGSLSFSLDVLQGSAVVLETGIAMRRTELTRASMARLLLTYPPMSLRVLGGIYWQAFRLWRKGTPYHPHARLGAEDRPAA
jgi:DUF1365 family protein